MNYSKLGVQIIIFGLAIVLGSFVGVTMYTSLGIINQLEQTATIILADFAVYLGLLRVAPRAAPKAGE